MTIHFNRLTGEGATPPEKGEGRIPGQDATHEQNDTLNSTVKQSRETERERGFVPADAVGRPHQELEASTVGRAAAFGGGGMTMLTTAINDTAAALTLFKDAPKKTFATCETCNLSNEDFLAVIFDNLPEGARAGVVSFAGNPHSAAKGAWYAHPAPALMPDSHNNYFTISSYFNDETGQFRRTKKTFAAMHVVMLDDLGVKVDISKVSLPLSWLIETSAGNYQGGYILAEPLGDAAASDRLMKGIIDAGLCDPGSGGPTARLARLPVAINGKHDPVFACKLIEWYPDRRYSVTEIVDGLGIELPAAGRPKKKCIKFEPPESQHDEVFIPAPEANPVIEALRGKALYKAALGGGKHDITCPWCAEHTSGIDSGAAYFEPDDGFPLGGFKCLHSHGNRLHIRDLLGFLSVQAAEARMKPTVRVQAGALNRIVDRAERLLADSGRYYQSAGLIATVRTDPANNETAIVPTTQPALVRALSRVADWERFDARTEGWVVADPPARHAGVLFDSSEYPHLPVLRGIARQPHLRDDGTLVAASGYDKPTGRFGVFDARQYHIPEHPTEVDSRRALAMLTDLLTEVAFDTAADRAAALAAMLTAACRPSLPTAPGFHVAAHTIGSGKSFLSRLISTLATPQNVPGIAFPGDGDEMRKTLIALLIKSPAVVNFDDLNGDIVPSEALKTALTEEYIGGRLLGVSKDVSCSTRTLFLFSGNNVGPVRDMARRVLTIHLDPRCENPVIREFKRPHLEAEVRRDRAKYVSAALTIIRAWVLAGTPRAPVKPVASYGKWADWCRHPLLWLDLPDPATRLFEQLAHDPDADLLRRMLTGWHDAHGSRVMLVREVVRLAESGADNDFAETLRDVAAERGVIDRKRLGWWLKRHAGRIIDSMKFAPEGSSRGAAAWKVQVLQVSQDSVGAIAKSVSTHTHDTADEIEVEL